MTTKQKDFMEAFAEVIQKLPEADQMYLLGRAEGMADAADKKEGK